MWGRRVGGKSWWRKGSNVLVSGEVSRLCPCACGGANGGFSNVMLVGVFGRSAPSRVRRPCRSRD